MARGQKKQKPTPGALMSLTALMSQRLNDGARVRRGDVFQCRAEEARDRIGRGLAEAAAPVAPLVADMVPPVDQD